MLLVDSINGLGIQRPVKVLRYLSYVSRRHCNLHYGYLLFAAGIASIVDRSGVVGKIAINKICLGSFNNDAWWQINGLIIALTAHEDAEKCAFARAVRTSHWK